MIDQKNTRLRWCFLKILFALILKIIFKISKKLLSYERERSGARPTGASQFSKINPPFGKIL
jgi:hypothetical protein